MQKVIIIGRPNVGKSSLFNRLANMRIAVTSLVALHVIQTRLILRYDKKCYDY